MTTIEFTKKLTDLQGKLMNFALKLTSDQEKAKDLLQETFIKALQNQHQFILYNNLKAWMYTIMKNTYINDYRRLKIQSKYTNQCRELSYLNFISTMDVYNPDSIYASNEIKHVIDNLDVKFKVPFKMHLEGFKYQEISETLEINLGTVKSRIFWARKKLMDYLKN